MNFYQYCLKHNVELLHDDKKFIKMFAGKLTKDILEHYVDVWFLAALDEPLCYKKQNAGRAAANLYLRAAMGM